MEFGAKKGLLQESGKEFMLKKSKLPDEFQRRVFKGKVREKVQYR